MSEINNNTVARWIIYIGVIIVSNLIRHAIHTNFKFPINRLMWCPGFGATYRCDIVLHGCTASTVTAVICWLASLLSTTQEGTIITNLGRIETTGCLSQIMLWVVITVHIFMWTFETGALAAADYEWGILFSYIVMLVTLFYMALLILFTEMSYRDAWED